MNHELYVLHELWAFKCTETSDSRPTYIHVLSGRIFSRQQTSWVLYNWLQVNTAYCTLDCRPWSKAIYNLELWLQNSTCRPYTADVSLQTTGCRTQTVDLSAHWLQNSTCKPQTVGLRLQNSTCRLQNAEFRLWTSQSAELDLQTSDHRLHTANWWFCDWYLERLRITFKMLSERMMVHMGQRSKRLELIPVSFAWSMRCLGVLLLPLDGVLVHHRLNPSSMSPVNRVPILNTLGEGRQCMRSGHRKCSVTEQEKP